METQNSPLPVRTETIPQPEQVTGVRRALVAVVLSAASRLSAYERTDLAGESVGGDRPHLPRDFTDQPFNGWQEPRLPLNRAERRHGLEEATRLSQAARERANLRQIR